MKIYEELQRRGLVAQVTDEPEISELINDGKATFYIGFDPTADSLHVGHFMALVLMKRLQLAGNKPIVLIGGATGAIGDPTGKTDMRKMMDADTIKHNCDCFVEQIGKFIEFGDDKAMVVNNRDWLLPLNYIELLNEIGACFSVNRMLSAECYKQRMERGLTFFELNYMIMQSYDFYTLYKKYGCNMQLGGDDQWSNMLAGTELIRRKLGKNAYAMTQKLLLNSEGVKMGKTVGGAVWLNAERTSPYDFYQYWRNVDDADVLRMMKMLTFIPIEEIEELEKTLSGAELNVQKARLAYEVTKMVHGEAEAERAEAAAKAVFSGGGNSDDMPTTAVADGSGLLDAMVAAGLAPSKSEARRLIQGGGISIDDVKVTDANMTLSLDSPIIIKKGKKIYHKITKA
ncbi:MAG: tyrosine--tRNA ligase [Ruminococcus sp.]|jgi:tyrosyl-tRNA synthetase|nr:tyrosine--tRNA ligase [Ruminococcus sp.]